MSKTDPTKKRRRTASPKPLRKKPGSDSLTPKKPYGTSAADRASRSRGNSDNSEEEEEMTREPKKARKSQQVRESENEESGESEGSGESEEDDDADGEDDDAGDKTAEDTGEGSDDDDENEEAIDRLVKKNDDRIIDVTSSTTTEEPAVAQQRVPPDGDLLHQDGNIPWAEYSRSIVELAELLYMANAVEYARAREGKGNDYVDEWHEDFGFPALDAGPMFDRWITPLCAGRMALTWDPEDYGRGLFHNPNIRMEASDQAICHKAYMKMKRHYNDQFIYIPEDEEVEFERMELPPSATMSSSDIPPRATRQATQQARATERAAVAAKRAAEEDETPRRPRAPMIKAKNFVDFIAETGDSDDTPMKSTHRSETSSPTKSIKEISTTSAGRNERSGAGKVHPQGQPVPS
jgi:hypothetical protein